MTSAAPARKPYRKAPPQHRETRHAPPTAPQPALQPDIDQVNKHSANTPVHLCYRPAAGWERPHSAGSNRAVPTSPVPRSDSELDVSSLSSLELCIPPPRLFSSRTGRTRATEDGVLEPDCRARSPRRHPSRDPSPRRHLSPRRHPSRDPSPHRTSRSSVSRGNPGSPGCRSPAAVRRCSPSCSAAGGRRSRTPRTQPAAPPKSILKQPASLDLHHAYDIIRKTKSAELLNNSRGGAAQHLPTLSLDRAEPWAPVSRRASAPPTPSRADWNWRMQVLEKVRFSSFLDEITCRVLSPARLTLLGRSLSREQGSPAPQRSHRPTHRNHQPERSSSDRTRRWDDWVASLRRPGSCHEPLQEKGAWQQDYITNGAGPKEDVNRGIDPERHRPPLSNLSLASNIKEALSDSDRIRILQQQNEDLRRRLSLSTHKMEAMEAEFDGSRHYMEAELSRTRDDLDKMRDKFRRLQNSYTASQRANQDLEEKLHALLRKVERDKKTMDQEIVELTNKLLDAKNTIDRLEELNERYRQDCNLAVQLLKCNKSHFRNHKFAD
ncbi:tight junction-associated protein 1, partial [Brachyistius frenatus]|uniref:tight junction-associated protein 1 n=1 Tax=Brachyistius frenatus TaxID=100188 RepID=UPI0037E90016